MNSLAMKDINEVIERRKWDRDAANSRRDKHHNNCLLCLGGRLCASGRELAADLDKANAVYSGLKR